MGIGAPDILLVANRGEIACRVIRTAHDLGYRTVAVYTDADAASPHREMADVAVHLPGATIAETYGSISAILAAAEGSGAGLVHPGYGFLSESAAFAKACEDTGLVFVGPPASAISAMADKAEAKARMRAAQVPVVPGAEGSADTLLQSAETVGYPLLVKARAGGGGRGMRRVDAPEQLADALTRASDEAERAFGDGGLLLERLIVGGRHVEVQVFADRQGTTIHLGERDCSTQRRHQKVIEEAPSPAVSSELRARMGAAAVAAAEAVGYVGAGTVEFLLDDSGEFYFLEMNTRLQVEHPVTEAVTGLDLVALQLRVASGQPLGLEQADIRLDGHAIEARLYAEDPTDGDRPQTGTLRLFEPSAALRVDTGVPDEIGAHYDPMLAKLIAHGPDRQTARRRLLRGLADTAVLGLRTNLDLLSRILAHPTFAEGEVRTDFLGTSPSLRNATPLSDTDLVLAARLWLDRTPTRPWRSAHVLDQPITLDIDGETHTLRLQGGGRIVTANAPEGLVVQTLSRTEHRARVSVAGRDETVSVVSTDDGLWFQRGTRTLEVRLHVARGRERDEASSGVVSAPGAGRVLAVSAQPGDVVEAGAPLVVVEAMKIETTLRAAVSGTVAEVRVAVGDLVKNGQIVAVLEVAPAPQEESP